MNMIKMEIKDSHRLINAGSLVLVSVAMEDERTITPVAWNAPVSGSPKLVIVALAKKHFSTELIERSRSFCINIPVWDMLDDVKFCGSVSGREVDKFAKRDLSFSQCETVENIYLNGCPARIECAVEEIIALGDHKLFVGEVKGSFCAEDMLTPNKTIDINRYAVIQHLGGNDFVTLRHPE